MSDHVTDSQKRYTSSPPTDVTDAPKRYVFVCAACGQLAQSSRRHALTCSNACRVQAHRTGRIKELTKIAQDAGIVAERTGKPMPSELLHAQALQRLLPDLAPAVMRGTMPMDLAQPRMVEELWRLVMKAAMAEASEQEGQP